MQAGPHGGSWCNGEPKGQVPSSAEHPSSTEGDGELTRHHAGVRDCGVPSAESADTLWCPTTLLEFTAGYGAPP